MSRIVFALVIGSTLTAPAAATEYFKIRVVDDLTGRGVPLVELTTVGGIRYYTDSNGLVAFHEPGLMDANVFFHVRSHGYEYPKDGFGFRGKRLHVVAGGSVTLEIKRINIAERLYRVTGGGIYRESMLLGEPAPTEHPVLNGRVLGSDSVVNTIYHGKVYWFWGDTNRPRYPLGNFHVPGATSLLPAEGGLDPARGVDLDYFVGKDGFAKSTAHMPGKGPTWIGGLVAIENAAGKEELYATYVKIRNPMVVYERGLCKFNDEKQEFEKVAIFDLKAPLFPRGHPVKYTEDGVEHIYFANPYPFVRVQADAEHLADLSTYEGYSCLKTGTRADRLDVDRSRDGAPRFAWRTNTAAMNPRLHSRLTKAGKIKLDESPIRLREHRTEKTVIAHGGSVHWNAFRKRWIMIAVESFGSSLLGEVWYAEADTLTGPWFNAVKIVTHDKYSFYNPKHHPFFDQDGGRFIYFEGTYTAMFSGNPDKTPRYNYNQIMYRLDLSDQRLKLAETK